MQGERLERVVEGVRVLVRALEPRDTLQMSNR